MSGPIAVALRRSRGGERCLGECERAALSAALSLGRQLGREVEALALGGPREDGALAIALRAGCARATRIDDRGARRIDYLATGRALAQALRQRGPSLVLIGDRSPDNHGGGVGPALAHWLDVPHLTAVVAAEAHGEAIEAVRVAGGERHRYRVPLPAVLCVASFPPISLVRGAPGRRPTRLDLASLDLERDELEARARAAPTPTRRAPGRAELVADAHALTGRLLADGLVPRREPLREARRGVEPERVSS